MSITSTEGAKHTVGPWTARVGDRPYVTAPDPNGSEHPITIADCAMPVAAHFQHQRLANARLFASAPDLLAACREAQAFLNTVDWNDATSEIDAANVRDVLRVAIDKAEG